ncbi:MAG: rod shape-determining protein RodA [Calditrichia bacterium]|jgi:rod shape determining protein RodA|nr:rod shape-determining protein RodA [Calditrichia bacterium]
MNQKIDYITILIVIVLVCCGLLAIYSATHTGDDNVNDYFSRQLMWAVFGIALMIMINFLSFKMLNRITYTLYGLTIALLILVLFIGKTGQGAERWLVLGSIRIQPSELAKLATILTVSRFLSDKYANVNKLKYLVSTIVLILIPFILIARQPDLGTALVFLALIIPILFWAGLNWFYLFVIISPLLTLILSFNLWAFMVLMFLITITLYLSKRKIYIAVGIFLINIGVGIATPKIWDQLHPYQQKRILTFINPEQDPKGAGYQIIQSQVAIGSGGIWGKGYLKGSQTHLRFLPAQHTDFIFSVIGEEFGYFGVVVILSLFLSLLLRLVFIASSVRSQFGSLTVIGVITVIFFHIIINIGMTIGLAPVTGLPLPFLSYGGSFLMINLLMIGVVLNISKNKFVM